MKKRILWITETALMLALLITLQWLTKPLGQLVTGSCVNAVLAITVLASGLSSGVTVALVSPIFAFLLGIAPQLLTVPAIMVGNLVFVVLLKLIAGDCKVIWKMVVAWLAAAAAKFAALYMLVVGVICGVAASALISGGQLKEPAIATLTATFSWPQLVTALIGGAVGLSIVPAIKKALHK